MAVDGTPEPAGRVTSVAGARPDAATAARFAALYREHYGRVVAYAYRRLGDRAAAEDCASEVFRIAWEKIGDGVPTPGWLFTTARYSVYHSRRDAARRTALDLTMAQELGRAADDDGLDRRLLAALDRLPEPARELLLAHYWDGLSGAECAALAGCSAQAIWIRLHRARQALRQEYERSDA